MSVFTAIGMKEPKWASDFKKNVIDKDTLPNPFKKVQSSGATATISKVENDVKIGFWIIVIILVIGLIGKFK